MKIIIDAALGATIWLSFWGGEFTTRAATMLLIQFADYFSINPFIVLSIQPRLSLQS